MRAVLLQLEITSNGRTVSYDSSGGGDPDYVLVDDNGRAKLARGDAPHLTYAAEWNAADSDERRRDVIKLAEQELDSIRKSQANFVVVEPKGARDARIVKDGEGWKAADVAIAFRCLKRDVIRAREAAGRDVEYGQLRRNGRELTRDELRAEIWRMTAMNMNDQQIADALKIPRGSVRYVLARPAPKT
jgi:hypothetical protein